LLGLRVPGIALLGPGDGLGTLAIGDAVLGSIFFRPLRYSRMETSIMTASPTTPQTLPTMIAVFGLVEEVEPAVFLDGEDEADCDGDDDSGVADEDDELEVPKLSSTPAYLRTPLLR
jgi:hypothetical protein